MMVPIWVYFVLVGIIVSAIMVIKTGNEERKIENKYIEKEGNVYIERMYEEKKKRAANKKEITAE